MFILFNNKEVVNIIMKCLSSLLKITKKKKKKTVLFKYHCITKFAYVYQATKNLGKIRIFFQNKLHILMLLIIIFISMLVM